MPHYLPKSIPWAHQETGIPIRTIYHLAKEGKLQKAVVDDPNNPSAGNIITLSDDAIGKLKGLATQRKRRKAIYELADKKGKNRVAAKKWLQRNRDLTNEKFETKLRQWLGIGIIS